MENLLKFFCFFDNPEIVIIEVMWHNKKENVKNKKRIG